MATSTNFITYCLQGSNPPGVLILDKYEKSDAPSNQLICKQLCSIAKSISQYLESQFNISFIGKPYPVAYLHQIKVSPPEWECKNTVLDKNICAFKFYGTDFSVLVPVIAHVYMHGVIDLLQSFSSSEESTALKESLVTVFSLHFLHSCVPHTKEHWQMSSYDMSKLVHYSQFKKSKYKSDVFFNSCIPSHAFYSSVKTSQDKESIIAKIWMKAMKALSSNATFVDFANETVAKAKLEDNPKADPSTQLASIITKSWQSVGVLLPSQPKKSFFDFLK